MTWLLSDRFIAVSDVTITIIVIALVLAFLVLALALSWDYWKQDVDWPWFPDEDPVCPECGAVGSHHCPSTCTEHLTCATWRRRRREEYMPTHFQPFDSSYALCGSWINPRTGSKATSPTPTCPVCQQRMAQEGRDLAALQADDDEGEEAPA